MQKIRVFINGFGRIGRSALRVMLEDETFEVVGINDIFPVSEYKYLLQYDSVYGELPHSIAIENETMHVNGHRIRLFCQEDPACLELSSLHVDVLLQCSGVFLTSRCNEPYLRQSVKKVILSAPPKDDTPSYVMGFNEACYRDEPIISNSSCSTNAIAPIIKTIDERFGIKDACISMVHSYTSDQNIVDAKGATNELRRLRSATQNILPLHSTATAILGSFFPRLQGKLYTKSIRVPVSATTLYDFTFHLNETTDREMVNALFAEAAQGPLCKVVDTDESCRVSSDYVRNSHSATIDLSLTEVLDGDCIKITAWQDNEFGYACQLVRMARLVCDTAL